MIAIVAPQPASWLEPLLHALPAGRPVLLFAPWALQVAAPRWMPGRASSFLRRRTLPAGSNATLRWWWPFLDGAAAAWSALGTPQRMSSRTLQRKLADALAARWLPADATLVIAPSLAARRTLAVARQRGAKTWLVEDLPWMRRLQDDLDRAAELHPSATFLRRYRAGRAVLVRQEEERALADRFLVRGLHAWQERVAAGVPESRLDRLNERPPPPRSPDLNSHGRGRGRVLLAGLATARSGVHEAVQAMAGRPDLTLLVRLGEGAEPDLLRHPNTAALRGSPLRALEGADLVLAPAFCETYPIEVLAAEASAIPIIGTRRAAGFASLAAEVAPGDAAGLRTAIDHLLGRRADA
jgi:hypothetical protein